MEIIKINKCVYDAISSVEQFFAQMHCLHVLTFVLKIPLTIVVSKILSHHSLYLNCFILLITLFQIAPIFLCSFTHQLKTIESLLRIIQWSNVFRIFYPNTKLLCKYISSSRTFDCGYFEINVSLLSILFNFGTLLYFAAIVC